jgi:hypothetical protein
MPTTLDRAVPQRGSLVQAIVSSAVAIPVVSIIVSLVGIRGS